MDGLVECEQNENRAIELEGKVLHIQMHRANNNNNMQAQNNVMQMQTIDGHMLPVSKIPHPLSSPLITLNLYHLNPFSLHFHFSISSPSLTLNSSIQIQSRLFISPFNRHPLVFASHT